MTQQSLGRRTLFWFVFILAGFLVAADMLIYHQQRSTLLEIKEKHAQHELALLGSLITEALNKGDYITVETFMREWAGSREDIVSTRLATETGFELARYDREAKAVYPFENAQTLKYGIDRKASLMIRRDLKAMHARLVLLQRNLFFISLLIVSIMAIVLWRTMLTTAILPLQREVDERRRAEQELEEQAGKLRFMRDEALKSTQAKSAFLANMSHELRTPLNSIIGFTGIVRSGGAGELNEEQEKQLGMVYSSAEHLLELINEVLDLSRVESGKVSLEREVFDVNDLVIEMMDVMQPLAKKKGLKFETSLDETLPQINSDRTKLRQVLQNLLSNALKFTDKGKVRVVTRLEDGVLMIEVIDTGIGIQHRDQEKVFDAFYQIDSKDSRREQGTGLGLTISKNFVELLGGQIVISKGDKVGTKVSVFFSENIFAS